MKQTAVEFYSQEEIKLTLDFLENKITQLEYGIKKLRLVEQAKEMEKEQRIQDYSVGYSNGQVDSNRTAEQYYNETFKIQ
jgi:hypothetical protein